VGDGQKAEFKKTANLIYSAAVAGASVAGMAKGALRGPKPKGPGATKAAKPLVAREMEIAGTGMRVKVPVEEPLVQTEVRFARAKSVPKAKAIRERKIDSPQMRNTYWDSLKKSGEWEYVPGYGKPTLRNIKTKQLIQKTIEKWEIEAYNEQGEHIGVIKPSDGKLRPELKVEGRRINK
jgi:hypothetical protein